MKNAVFWDIKPQFVFHRRHITSLLQSPAGQCYVRFEGFTAVNMKNAVFFDVTPFGSCKNQSFGGPHYLHHQGDKNSWPRIFSRRYVPSNCRFLQEPHGVTSQKTAFVIVTAVKTSNLTSQTLLNYYGTNIFLLLYHYIYILSRATDG
jgi:hypothetical protein